MFSCFTALVLFSDWFHGGKQFCEVDSLSVCLQVQPCKVTTDINLRWTTCLFTSVSDNSSSICPETDPGDCDDLTCYSYSHSFTTLLLWALLVFYRSNLLFRTQCQYINCLRIHYITETLSMNASEISEMTLFDRVYLVRKHADGINYTATPFYFPICFPSVLVHDFAMSSCFIVS